MNPEQRKFKKVIKKRRKRQAYLKNKTIQKLARITAEKQRKANILERVQRNERAKIVIT